jgi:hypothetical protein
MLYACKKGLQDKTHESEKCVLGSGLCEDEHGRRTKTTKVLFVLAEKCQQEVFHRRKMYRVRVLLKILGLGKIIFSGLWVRSHF